MSKKYKPTFGTKDKKLDTIVKEGVNVSSSQSKESSERITNGYRIRKDYVRNISLLSSAFEKKKFQIIEEALEDYFNKHTEVLQKLQNLS